MNFVSLRPMSSKSAHNILLLGSGGRECALAWKLRQSTLCNKLCIAPGNGGTAAYGWITRRVSLGDIMRIGLVIETLTHLALALTASPAVALPVFFVFGAHAFVWGTTSRVVRQRAVPMHLQGRVDSVNSICVYGGLVVGSAFGGLLATHYGIAAPFWFAFAGSAVFVILLWPQMTQISHQDL